MRPRKPGALSRGAARVMGSRFAKPARARRSRRHGPRSSRRRSVARAPPGPSADLRLGRGPPAPTPRPTSASPSRPPTASPRRRALRRRLPRAARQGAASPDDPVILNTAAADDLRRLPGIGQKRADAILALRARLGRFRAIEDLLKVKGIGRATLKRLRPARPPRRAIVVAPSVADAGMPPTARLITVEEVATAGSRRECPRSGAPFTALRRASTSGCTCA